VSYGPYVNIRYPVNSGSCRIVKIAIWYIPTFWWRDFTGNEPDWYGGPKTKEQNKVRTETQELKHTQGGAEHEQRSDTLEAKYSPPSQGCYNIPLASKSLHPDRTSIRSAVFAQRKYVTDRHRLVHKLKHQVMGTSVTTARTAHVKHSTWHTELPQLNTQMFHLLIRLEEIIKQVQRSIVFVIVFSTL